MLTTTIQRGEPATEGTRLGRGPRWRARVELSARDLDGTSRSRAAEAHAGRALPVLRPRSRSGFSLVEVCAAIVLLTVIIGGILGAQTAALGLTLSARDTAIATSDAQAALEEILLQSTDDIPVLFPAGVPIAAWTNRNLTDESIVPTYPSMVGADVPDPLEVRLTLTWRDYVGRSRTIFLSTVKVR